MQLAESGMWETLQDKWLVSSTNEWQKQKKEKERVEIHEWKKLKKHQPNGIRGSYLNHESKTSVVKKICKTIGRMWILTRYLMMSRNSCFLNVIMALWLYYFQMFLSSEIQTYLQWNGWYLEISLK